MNPLTQSPPGPVADALAADLGRRVRDRFVGLDRLVPIHDAPDRPYINLDNAATTPALRDVADVVQEFLDWYGSVHRGTGLKSRISTRAYDHAREIIGGFVGADPSAHVVILTTGATGAINKLARTLGARGRPLVLCTQMEHHSNLLPWRAHCRVECANVVPRHGGLDMADLEAKLHRHRGEVRLVAVTGASNVTGLMPPLRRIARLAHEHGAELFVDAAQWAPHRPVRMGPPGEAESLDYLAFSGHKMYAPFGIGALIGPRAAFADGAPEGVGGGTIRLVTPDDVVWADAPAREEPGTPNVVGAVALARAMRALDEIGMEAVAAHDAALRRLCVAALRAIPGLRIYGDPAPEGHEHVGVVSFVADRMDHSLLAAALGHEWGIAVRHGCFCAHPYIMRLLGVTDVALQDIFRKARNDDHSDFPGLVRVSFGAYNTAEEVAALAEAVRTLLARGPRGRYVLDRPSGEYVPENGQDPDDDRFIL